MTLPRWEPLSVEGEPPGVRPGYGLMAAAGASPTTQRRSCLESARSRGGALLLLLLTSGLLLAATLSGLREVARRRAAPRACADTSFLEDRPLTDDPQTWHVLTNEGVWSPDSSSVVFDVRRNKSFNGDYIGLARLAPGSAPSVLYERPSRQAGGCGIAQFMGAAHAGQVAFILGPGQGDPAWTYQFWHRRGVIANASDPGQPLQTSTVGERVEGACVHRLLEALDARDLVAPYTPGALRGGTHVHKSSGDGLLVASNYEDAVLQELGGAVTADANRRQLAVTVLGIPVAVPARHPHNTNGSHTVVVSTVHDVPLRGSDQVARLHDHAWVGARGYLSPTGKRRKYAIAVLGLVTGRDGKAVSQVFVIDLPDDPAALARAAPGMPLEGTSLTRPQPPANVTQRALTRLPRGVATSPRFWPASSPDGAAIAFLAADAAGVTQLFTTSPAAAPGAERQLSSNAHSVSSAFSWSPDGRWIAHHMDGSVCATSALTGATLRLTPPATLDLRLAPRPDAVVFSPDGAHIAYLRGEDAPQIWVLEVSRLQSCLVEGEEEPYAGDRRRLPTQPHPPGRRKRKAPLRATPPAN
eukprot:jgi/Tetstr1/447081/TSEL_034519.t1